MRVGIAYNTGEIAKVVEFKAMTFGAVDSIAQNLLEKSGCLKDDNTLDLSRYNGEKHYVTAETLTKLHELYACSTDKNPVTVVFYNDDSIKSEDIPVDTEGDYNHLENYLERLTCDIEDLVSFDEFTVRYMDDITTSSVPLCCIAAFKDMESANDFFNDVYTNGWADTSLAELLFVLYKDLVVKHDKADYYASVYKLDNK